MRARYTLIFLLLACACVWVAVTSGPAGWWAFWPALSFLILAGAYSVVGARALGKQPDGRMTGWAVLLLLPYLLVAWGIWRLQRWLTSEPCAHEITAGLWLSRRPFCHELPANATLLVDLTAEFPRTPHLPASVRYVCLATLDGCPLETGGLRAIVETIVSHPGTVVVHCAQGHGRSAMVVAAVLLAKGLAVNVDDAVRIIRQVRPGVHLGPNHRAVLAAAFCEP